MLSEAPRMASARDAEWFWFLGTRMTVRVRAADTGGCYGMIEQELPPGFAPAAHIHRNEDEQFYILTGRFTFHCGEQVLPAGPGDMILLPRGIPHSFVVEGSEPARLLQLTTPGGVEEFFVELGTPATDERPPDGPPDLERLVTAANRYQIEFVDPA